ncbi:MAG: cytochrome c-type biogenesis protein CcmH [Burkholderiales bacterium]|nr:cytochrome c-type biogenesis protein CcmH [Burkholderiales bacterium]
MYKKIIVAFLLLFFAISSGLVFAQAPSRLMQESIEISKELRDPSATNQSLYESEAPAAAELKARIYQMLEQGKTKSEILKFFAERYGEQIRYQPALSVSTSLLWIVPICLILIIFVWIFWFVFKAKKRVSTMGNQSGQTTLNN